MLERGAMSLEDRIAAKASQGSEWPERFALPGVYDEIEINQSFRHLRNDPKAAETVRSNKNSLHAMTPEAVKAVLPHYLMFGLRDGETGIMDHIIYFFTAKEGRTQALRKYLAVLTPEEVELLTEAIAAFRDSFDVSELLKHQASSAIEDVNKHYVPRSD